MSWNENEKDQFFKRLAVLAETMGEPLTPVRLAGYCEALEDVPLAAILIGLREAARTCRFFPKPAELRELGLGSPAWRRQQEAEWERVRRPLLRPPAMTREETQAAIAKLKAALRGLSAAKRMR